MPPLDLSRRRLLATLGGITVGAAGCGGEPDRPPGVASTDLHGRLRHEINESLIPDVVPWPLEEHTFVSPARLGRRVRWILIRPPSITEPLPVAIALHGHGGSARQLASHPYDLTRFLAAAVADGVPPFLIAAPSGGNTFWHPRPSGEDAGAMVTDELLPRLAARDDVRPGKVGLMGWSMGGYGALRLGGLLGAEQVAAVCAGSPGLYLEAGEAHPDGFADAAEYEKFSVFGQQQDLAGIPVRLACGTEDYFYEPTRAYAEGFPERASVETEYGPGGHEPNFTLAHMPRDLAFMGSALADG